MKTIYTVVRVNQDLEKTKSHSLPITLSWQSDSGCVIRQTCKHLKSCSNSAVYARKCFHLAGVMGPGFVWSCIHRYAAGMC